MPAIAVHGYQHVFFAVVKLAPTLKMIPSVISGDAKVLPSEVSSPLYFVHT